MDYYIDVLNCRFGLQQIDKYIEIKSGLNI
jgi:hypothetical protein